MESEIWKCGWDDDEFHKGEDHEGSCRPLLSPFILYRMIFKSIGVFKSEE